MARLHFRPGVLKANLDVVWRFCRERNLEMLPVTKLVHSRPDLLVPLAHPALTRVADVQATNLARLNPGQFPGRELLRPRVQDAELTVRHATRVFLSDPDLALTLGRLRAELPELPPLGIMLMIEAGDLRDGVPWDEAPEVLKVLSRQKGLSLDGLAVNFGCLAGAVPTLESLEILAMGLQHLRKVTGLPLPRFSLGGTVLWHLLSNTAIPPEFTELRIGEAFFFAWNTSLREPLPDLSPQVFEMELEVLEVWNKLVDVNDPALQQGYNAFGETSIQAFSGFRKRAVLDGGENFSPWRALTPLERGITCVGATHEYTVVDVTESPRAWKSGDTVSFQPAYEAVARGFHSPYLSLQVHPILNQELSP